MRVRSHLNIVKISKGNGNKILAATVTYLQFLQQILKKNAHLNSANTCDTLEVIIVLKNTVVNKVFYQMREISFELSVNENSCVEITSTKSELLSSAVCLHFFCHLTVVFYVLL
jgi:hypothetical protein